MQSIAVAPTRMLTLVQATGDHASAIVLSQIMYWHDGRLQVQRKGSYWLAKSRTEMCAETGITLDQYKRIMPLLAKLGLIVMERGLFKGKVTPHIQLTDAGWTLMFGKGSSNPVEAPPPPHWGTVTPTITETTTKNTTEDLATENVALANDIDNGDGTEKKDEMKATEILKAHQGVMNGSLGAFWKSRCANVGGGYQKPLTGKEQGQLKQLSKYLGDDTKPVIDYAVSHWVKFASLAGLAAGVSPPEAPNIGFLLKHHAVAVNLLTPSASPPTTVVEGPVQSIASNAESEPAHQLTSQELTQLLDSFKAP